LHPVVPWAGRLPGADLFRRVFAEDVLRCPCGGHRSVVAFVADAAPSRSRRPSAGWQLAAARDDEQDLVDEHQEVPIGGGR
jgi:hypothetical protein